MERRVFVAGWEFGVAARAASRMAFIGRHRVFRVATLSTLTAIL
jgi:hypothetical protein